jgi:hypothetical protein
MDCFVTPGWQPGGEPLCEHPYVRYNGACFGGEGPSLAKHAKGGAKKHETSELGVLGERRFFLYHALSPGASRGLMIATAALKEWAIVCDALAAGRQVVLVRKGGILEVKHGFEVAHREFWLFPTYVHQKADDLVPDVRGDLARVHAGQPRPGWLAIGLHARVTDEIKVADLAQLRALQGHHILSWDCVASRFQYRNRPGVHVLVLRVSERPVAQIPYREWYDGCVSWVELDEGIETSGMRPVLSDEEFEARRREVIAAVSSAAVR